MWVELALLGLVIAVHLIISRRRSATKGSPKKQSSSGAQADKADTAETNLDESPRSPSSLSKALKADASRREIAMRANDIRSCGKNGDLKGAIKVYDRLGDQAKNTLIMNSMLDACIECADLDKAIQVFSEIRSHELADVISYNTMMKGYISNGQEAEAKRLLAELSEQGLSATRSSYHGILNARVNARDFRGAWQIVAEMQASGTSPNAVTCSILLKGSSLHDIPRVLALIDAMDQPMDEVLFVSLVDGCIRTGRLDMLTRHTESFMKQDASSALTAATYGTMIKAFGHARDVKHVWNLWGQMINHKVQPTSITIGCMVEALVANGRTSDAWLLTQKMLNDSSMRPLVNNVIYSSILKGFAHTKDTEKVVAVYEEMQLHQIPANKITFNTILNAFAQGETMHRVPALLEDMKAANPPVEPDIVTYSTIVKGFCNAGYLDRALKVLGDMQASGVHAPDEVMYNSLLGGCAKEQRPDEALELLNDMRKYNVKPSNYTLSMLVKLMGRCKRLDQAFIMLEDISKEYGLKINIQVYTCLMQGCIYAGQPGRAVALLEKTLQEGLAPDARTYSVLVRGCVHGGLLTEAAELVRSAHGVGQDPCSGGAPGLTDGCIDELLVALDEKEASELLATIGDCKIVASRRPPAGTRYAGATPAMSKGAQRPQRAWR